MKKAIVKKEVYKLVEVQENEINLYEFDDLSNSSQQTALDQLAGIYRGYDIEKADYRYIKEVAEDSFTNAGFPQNISIKVDAYDNIEVTASTDENGYQLNHTNSLIINRAFEYAGLEFTVEDIGNGYNDGAKLSVSFNSNRNTVWKDSIGIDVYMHYHNTLSGQEQIELKEKIEIAEKFMENEYSKIKEEILDEAVEGYNSFLEYYQSEEYLVDELRHDEIYFDKDGSIIEDDYKMVETLEDKIRATQERLPQKEPKTNNGPSGRDER